MTRLPPELTSAFDRVSDAYNEIPEEKRPRVDGPEWQKREEAIDVAFRAGDAKELTVAIAAWERYATTLFKVAAK